MRTDIQPNLVYRYLLGDLPEAEQLALEQRFLTDGDAFERVWEIENQLVDRYVRGGLTGDERALFEQNYLSSPLHRERVDLARTLVGVVDSHAESEERHSEAQPSIPWWSTFPISFRRGAWRWAMIGAMLALGLASIGLFSERASLQKQISQLNEARASQQRRAEDLEKEATAQRENSERLQAEIKGLREGPENPGHPAQTSPAQNDLHPVVSFLLSPMLMRSTGESQQLKIAKETSVIALEMKVQVHEARMFQVALRTVEGTEVWSKASIKARPQGKNRFLVSAIVPAGKLDTGDYILILSATRGETGAQEVNQYFFRVVKQ